jgi:hypothetical protein
MVPCHKVIAANKGLGEWNKENAVTKACEEESKKGAGEGEFSTRLLSGETASFNASTSEGKWELVAGTKVVTCNKIKVAGEALEGSTGENAGKSKETVEFEECVVAGNGTKCAVEGGKITTEPLTDTLGYASEASGEGNGKILTIFKPAAGAKFAKINFVPEAGGTCNVANTIVETKAGCTPACEGVIAADETELGGLDEVDAEPAAEPINDLNFPATEIKEIHTEAGGTLTKRSGGIAAFGVKAQQKGGADIELSGAFAGRNWGVFSSEKGDGI